MTRRLSTICMLDRLDSVVFAAPVFFHATPHWWA
jgi:predicted CDP-diglyceride synthetase/phosphatidate cytidylyltransferase